MPIRRTIVIVLMLGVVALGQTTRVVDRRLNIVRYTVGQRVEVLKGEEWVVASVLGWDNGKVRIRTDANEEMLARPIELRKFTNARSYPVKAAPEDVAAINPPPKAAVGGPRAGDLIKPGLPQLVEPEAGEKPKVVEPAVAEQPRARGEMPLPPAPNPLPNEVPSGDLTTATPLASPEKVSTLAIYQADGAGAPAHGVTKGVLAIRALDTRDAVFESAAPLLFTSPEFGQVFVPHRDRSVEAATSLYYDRFDVGKGQRNGGFAAPAGGRVLDVSPDGTRLLVSWTSEGGGGVQEDCLGIFVVLNDRLSLRSAWRPYGSIRVQTSKGVESGFFTDNTYVVTSMGSDLVMWDADTNRAVYRMYPISPVRPAASPSRRYVAVVVGGTPWLLDATSGQPAVKLDGALPAGTAGGVLSVRPDGKQVACLVEGRVLVWDVAEPGQSARAGGADVSLVIPNTAVPAERIDWLADGFVLVNGRYCVDVAKQVLLWEYVAEENGVGGTFGGEYWYSVSGQGGRMLAHRRLPHEMAVQEASKIDAEGVMAVRPGAKVSIDLSKVEGGELLKQRAVAALTGRLQANGMEVVENAPVRLVVSSAEGEAREITYRGATEATTATVNLPEDLVTVAFVVGGKTAWQVTRPATPPGTLALRPGQTAEEFLTAERGRLRLVTASNVVLPKFVPVPRETPFYGKSVLTEGEPRSAEQ